MQSAERGIVNLVQESYGGAIVLFLTPVRADGGEEQRLDAVGGGVARHLRAVSSEQSEVGGHQSEVGSAQKVASGERRQWAVK